MQETRVRALVREDPTCCGATKPVGFCFLDSRSVDPEAEESELGDGLTVLCPKEPGQVQFRVGAAYSWPHLGQDGGGAGRGWAAGLKMKLRWACTRHLPCSGKELCTPNPAEIGAQTLWGWRRGTRRHKTVGASCTDLPNSRRGRKVGPLPFRVIAFRTAVTGRARVRAQGRVRNPASVEPAKPEVARGSRMPEVPRTDPPRTFVDTVRCGTAVSFLMFLKMRCWAQQPRQIQPRLKQLWDDSHVAGAGPSTGADGTPQPSEELQLASGLQESSLRERRDVGRDYRDFVVNTRQKLGHVRESTKARNAFVTQWSLVSLEELRDLFSLSQKKEVVSKLKNQPVKITFELSRELQTTSPDCLCYYNILLLIFTALSTKPILPISRMLEKMDLNTVGRNDYNKSKKTEFYKNRYKSILACLVYYLSDFFFKGLTDDLRKDYGMMRELSTYMRMDPGRRQRKLLTLMDALRE
ncbi:hypothetical protein J1605_000010 [Eschrichtius robustus]|uniref:Uncharacterized protein n=1 Tax=Eschrichtius robustus TaxID=9764 RepID=A0AB34I626_ESCRO|nr:hypothetical protein J1605_000010 [Eschrichtius robustus]